MDMDTREFMGGQKTMDIRHSHKMTHSGGYVNG